MTTGTTDTTKTDPDATKNAIDIAVDTAIDNDDNIAIRSAIESAIESAVESERQLTGAIEGADPLAVAQRAYLKSLRTFLDKLNDILYRVHLHTCKGERLPKPGQISDIYSRFEDTLKEWDKVLKDL